MLKDLMPWSPMHHLRAGDGSISLLTRCREKQKLRQELLIVFYNHNNHTRAHTHMTVQTCVPDLGLDYFGINFNASGSKLHSNGRL